MPEADYGIVKWARLPAPIVEKIQQWAKEEKRAFANQMAYILEQAVLQREAERAQREEQEKQPKSPKKG